MVDNSHIQLFVRKLLMPIRLSDPQSRDDESEAAKRRVQELEEELEQLLKVSVSIPASHPSEWRHLCECINPPK